MPHVRARTLGWALPFLIACAHAPSQPANPPSPVSVPSVDADPLPELQAPREPALPRAIEALSGAGLKSGIYSTKTADRAAKNGLSQELAIAALDEISATCDDHSSQSCGGDLDLVKTRARLVQWLRYRGGEAAMPILLQLDGRGELGAGRALHAVLSRRANARPASCTPPAIDTVSEVQASLADFAVFDRRRKKLTARPLTEAEAADLAYFLVAVEGAGTPTGTDDQSFKSGTKPSETFTSDQKGALERQKRALFYGDAEEIVRTGVAYLEPLGFPGKIDRSLEGDMSWGGARYSYVMRDVALAAEVAEDYDLASALYRRANPGGGACGTSVSTRRGRQIKGLIRSSDAAGRCNDVVAERLLDWDGDRDTYYGPDRLADAGFDIARIYRGAFLTRHRDLPEPRLLEALAQAPEAFAGAARARIEAKGTEAWETRVWAIEGLADTLGRDGGFFLASALPQLEDAQRQRAIEAIGSAGHRYTIGPCDENSVLGLGMGWSSFWTRPVGVFGTSCELAYSDDQAKQLYRSFRSDLRATSPSLQASAVNAAASLGVVSAVRDLRKLHARNERAASACQPDDDTNCYTEENALERTREALEHIESLKTELRARRQ